MDLSFTLAFGPHHTFSQATKTIKASSATALFKKKTATWKYLEEVSEFSQSLFRESYFHLPETDFDQSQWRLSGPEWRPDTPVYLKDSSPTPPMPNAVI